MGKSWVEKALGGALLGGPLGVWGSFYYSVGKSGKLLYNKYTGHYNRQKDRAGEEQTRKEMYDQKRYAEQERRDMFIKRKTDIDELREKKGIGVNYKTSTRGSVMGRNNILG